MSKQIKELKWLECPLTGNSEVTTLAYEYVVLESSESGGYMVNYYNLRNSDPAKPATGFATREQAKEWAFNHHCEKMAKWLNPDTLTQTLNWFKEAKPEPNSKDIITQIGCHYEEVAEMAESLCRPRETDFSRITRVTSQFFKEADIAPDHDINDIIPDPIETLDSLVDQIVTAVGVGYMMGFDIIGALTEVNKSNYSKFVDGKAVTDENGKIIKGENYFKPNLESFVGGAE